MLPTKVSIAKIQIRNENQLYKKSLSEMKGFFYNLYVF